MNPELRGLWPAMLTPLNETGAIDVSCALAHGKHLLTQGCDGISIFGTTGEGPAFSVAERMGLLLDLVDGGIAPGRLMIGTAAAALPDAIELSRQASALGCAAVLFIPPFYFGQPSDAGVVKATSELIEAVADSNLKILLYHIPALSGVAFSMDVIAELRRRHPRQVVGVKDSTGERLHSLKLVQNFPDLSVFVGNELDIQQTMQAGGAGSICGLANIAPRLLTRVAASYAEPRARDQDAMEQLLSLIGSDYFLPVFKAILAEQSGNEGWARVRAPLLPLDPAAAQHVRQRYRAIAAVFLDL